MVFIFLGGFCFFFMSFQHSHYLFCLQYSFSVFLNKSNKWYLKNVSPFWIIHDFRDDFPLQKSRFEGRFLFINFSMKKRRKPALLPKNAIQSRKWKDNLKSFSVFVFKKIQQSYGCSWLRGGYSHISQIRQKLKKFFGKFDQNFWEIRSNFLENCDWRRWFLRKYLCIQSHSPVDTKYNNIFWNYILVLSCFLFVYVFVAYYCHYDYWTICLEKQNTQKPKKNSKNILFTRNREKTKFVLKKSFILFFYENICQAFVLIPAVAK